MTKKSAKQPDDMLEDERVYVRKAERFVNACVGCWKLEIGGRLIGDIERQTRSRWGLLFEAHLTGTSSVGGGEGTTTS